MVATTALTLTLLAHALLADAVPVAQPVAPPRSLKIRGPPRLQKRGRDNLDALRAKWEANVARAKSAGSSTSAPSKKVRRATGNVALTDFISQGVDEEYYGDMQIGTPSQTVAVDFDTGSADLWVPTTCDECLGDDPSLDLTQSSTYHNTGRRFQVQYGSGAVRGTVASDTVTLAGMTIPQQFFGSVEQVTSNFIGNGATGILGLAFPTIANDREPTVFENLVTQGSVDAPQFSFYLSRGVANGSELSLGAADPSKFTGDTYYTNVTSQTYWEVQSTGLTANGANVGGAFPAAIDTGTTLMYVPTAVAAAFYAAIPGAQEISEDGSTGSPTVSGANDVGSGEYVFPCDSNVPIAIGFEGTPALSISYDDLNLGEVGQGFCEGGIAGVDIQDANGNTFAIVGDLFLKSWYSTFDMNGPRVGFAEALH